MEKFKASEQFRQIAEFFFKGLSLKYANWGKNTTVRSMQNKISFLAVLFSAQLCSCFSHLLISVFYNLDGNYSSPTGCYEHLGTEKTGGNPGTRCSLLKKKKKNYSFSKCPRKCDVPQHCELPGKRIS